MNISKFNRKTKIERSKEIREKTEARNKIELSPQTPVEHAIKDLSNVVNKTWRKRPVNESINLYVNARNLRHDIWVDLFDRCNKLKAQAGDVKVSDFLYKMKKDFNITINMPEESKRQTPDILMYVKEHGYVVLGDVAVTVSARAANARKHIKYRAIATSIEAAGIPVRHMNLIIKDDLTNVESALGEFISADVIENKVELFRRATEYCRVCQKMMVDIPNTTDSQSDFYLALEYMDKDTATAEIGVEINIDPTTLHDENHPPTRAEPEIIRMIKLATDNLTKEGYLSGTIDQANSEIDQLLASNNGREFMNPKATIKVTDNSSEFEHFSNYDLIKSYIDDLRFNGTDDGIVEYIIDLLPSKKQVDCMEAIYKDKSHIKKKTFKESKVYGPYQYDRTTNSENVITMDLNNKLTYGKKKRNIKAQPKTINPEQYDECKQQVEKMISYYGSTSSKMPFLDESWDCKTNFEMENTEDCRKVYNFVKSTNGAQMCQSLSNLYQRITHLKTSLGSKDNIFVPQNASYICIIPKNHAPITNKTCDLPFIFLTRYTNKYIMENGIGIEYEISVKTKDYTYFVSKLCRYNMDKIAHWDQAGYKIVSTCTYLLTTCGKLMPQKERVVGILTLLAIDSHQKTSEYLELMKYIAYMPFSDIHMLPDLISDKLDLLIKTCLDVWMVREMKTFINELSKIEKLEAKKPRIQLFNTTVTRESLGLSVKLPSFMCNGIRHGTVTDFIEEVQLIFTIRPKQLYGSQFMDKSIHSTAEWNLEYEDEIRTYGDWAVNGNGEDSFPFEAKFCYSRDAILHAMSYYKDNVPLTTKKVSTKLSQTKYDKYMHTNCTLRGCVKSHERRKNPSDYHTTSLEECLYQYQKNEYDQYKCTAIGMALESIKNGHVQEYSMSEKEQRGPGRPISTPDIHTKAELMVVEKPEQAIGQLVPNNIIVPGKNKLKEQCEAYKSLLSEGSTKGYKYVYQLTEDQSKFSENDNTRKFEVYIKNNQFLDKDVRALQLSVIKKLVNREHLVHRIPESIKKNPELRKYINNNGTGIRAIIGWPQGMLNFISTSIHSIADLWITHAFNEAYPDEAVITKGLVHSDDSWLAIACDSLATFRKFCIFRMLAKKMFCLKLNIKKLWGSKYLGELVSNYNVNGNVHLSVAKVITNCFNNLTYQNWVLDVNSQISSMQQAYRNGAQLETLVLLSTILRQQIFGSYNVDGKQKELAHMLPIELGGYPNSSAFELGVTGLSSYYSSLAAATKNNPTTDPSVIMLKALRLSLINNIEKEKAISDPDKAVTIACMNRSNNVQKHLIPKTNIVKPLLADSSTEPSPLTFDNVDYESIQIPSRGEVFSCVKHIMPKSKKIAQTILAIRNIPFDGNGLEMIITDPIDIKVALGNLKVRTSTMMYNLAADKYSSNAKRLAISQAIQASGKVCKIGNLAPMTINELLEYLLEAENISPVSSELLESAFVDSTDLSLITSSAVYSATYSACNDDKRKIVNKQPEIEDRFKTVAKLKHVLLFIVDRELGTNHLIRHGHSIEPYDLLKQDSDLIKRRFSSYFNFYHVKQACNIIMQQWLITNKSRYWMQPYLKSDSIITFIEDLYGKTVNSQINYIVSIDISEQHIRTEETDLINTIYTMDVLNALYEGKFTIENIKGKTVSNILQSIDYSKLTQDQYLKFAILCMIHNKDYKHVEIFDNRRIYDQRYILAQKMIDGRYQGKFSCKVKYGKTVMIIEGVEKGITITANNNNINEILFGMMMFVNKNFPYYSYNHPNAWSSTGFYQNDMAFSYLFLTSYTNNVTVIGKSKTGNSIPLIINKNLVMEETYNNVLADKYYCDETLKTLYKEVNGQKIKVSHVKQNLMCPKIQDVNLIQDELEGFNNQLLLEGKTIIYITTRKHFNCNKKIVHKIMDNRMLPYPAALILRVWAAFINKFKQVFNHVDFDDADENCEVITYDIHGQSAYDIIEQGLMTNPEDLTHVDVDYMFYEEDRIGGIYKYKKITNALAKIISGHLTTSDAEDIIYLLIKDEEFTDCLKSDLQLTLEEIVAKYDEIEDIVSNYHLTSELYSALVSSGMNCEEFWDNLDMVKVLQKPKIGVLSSYTFHQKENLKASILEIIYDKEREGNIPTLLNLAKMVQVESSNK
ncbi:MAG: RNA-dependent RNA polymerase [Fushun Phasmavirus 3]|nr:MAG: RNA-dependent RNA polymerase [Fushun Phasmavirus 3]